MKKISMLFAHRESDKWTCPLAYKRELENNGFECKIYSTFDKNDNWVDDNLKTLLSDAFYGIFVPDIIFHLDFGLFKSSLLDKQLFPKAKWVFESGDDPQSFYYNFTKTQQAKFDLVLSPDIRAVDKYNQSGYKCIWCPHFGDETLYKNSNITPIYDAVTTRADNDAFFKQVRERLGNRFKNQVGLHAEEHADFLMQGKIVIQNSQYKEITRRLFEGMLANRMVIADRPDPNTQIDLIFQEGKDIIYFDSFEDCISKVNYYTNHDEERFKIAQSGYDKVKKNHTIKKRVEKLIPFLLE